MNTNVLNKSGDVCHVLLTLRKKCQNFERCFLFYFNEFDHVLTFSEAREIPNGYFELASTQK